MTPDLIIWMETDPEAAWHWTVPSSGQSSGQTASSGKAGSEAEKSELGAREFKHAAVIIAGQAVRILAPDLPQLTQKTLSQKERLAAAGYALEDDIGASLSGQHVVIGANDDGRVAIISRAVMTGIIAALDKAGFEDAAIYADFDALSSAERPLALGGRVIDARALGYTVDTQWYDPAQLKNQAVQQVSSALELSQYVDLDGAINLRQNDFASRKSFGFSGQKINIQNLMQLAALAVLCTFTWLAFQVSHARANSAQAAHINTQTRQIYSQATGAPAPPNPALAASRALQSGPVVQAGFIDLSKVLFDAVAKTDGIIVESLRYDKARADLSLRLIYPNFESTTELEIATQRLGGIFEAGGVREQGGQLIGDASLRLGGAR